MGRKSIIIIGAGLAGLSTGCYAQMNDYDSRIFEHHSKPGGLAAVWKRGEYLIDGGIHFLIGHRPGNPIYDVYSEIGGVGQCAVEDMTTYMRFADATGSNVIDFTNDLERLERDLLRISPEDKKEIRSFLKEVHSLKDSPLLTDLGMSTAPPELRGRLDSLKEMWQMRGFMKYFVGKFSKSASVYSKRFQHPFLKTVIKNLFAPNISIWFVIMILASVAGGILGLIKDGCQEFVRPIEKRYKSLGGQIQYRSTVEEILVEDDRAVGIKLSDGSEHRADVVISAADGKSTIFKLLDGNYVDEKIVSRYETWKPYDPIIMVSLGVARTFENDAPLNMLALKEPLQLGERKISFVPLRVMNYGNAFAPVGKTVIQVMLETDWEYWNNLQMSREEYDAEKERLAEDVITSLEAYYPGISSQIEKIDVATPYTTWRYTLNDKGSPMGWQMTNSTIMEQVPRSLPGLQNFLMAGQWVLPGGGVPGCIYTGRNAIQILCKRDKKPFRTKIPEP
ncbi:MAG: phytoene desaturase family protein [Candidatus Thorarchaeota archaeon]|jgi:phytoene dehydrogenase-like protein